MESEKVGWTERRRVRREIPIGASCYSSNGAYRTAAPNAP